jgi:hypothetical protein
VKTFTQFIKEAENNIRSLEPYRAMPPLKKTDGTPNPAPQRFLINPKTGFGPSQQAQMAPQKPPIAPGVPINLDSPGIKLFRLLKQQKA